MNTFSKYVLIFIFGLFSLGTIGTLHGQDTDVEIERARKKAKTTKQQYLRIKKLSQLGSASQKQVRDAELVRNLALIELSDLVSPEKQIENSRLRAKIVLKYRQVELDVLKKLLRSGSVSETVYRRAVAAHEVAQSRLKAIESITETQKKIQLIKAAKAKFDVADKEYGIATRLYKKGSISKDTMDRASDNLGTAKSELEQAKKSLGATAFEVKQ